MGVEVASYVGLDAATLTTMQSETLAEIRRQKLAGANFGQPGGRTRGGVAFADLLAELRAINYALGLLNGTVIEEVVVDCSASLE